MKQTSEVVKLSETAIHRRSSNADILKAISFFNGLNVLELHGNFIEQEKILTLIRNG